MSAVPLPSPLSLAEVLPRIVDLAETAGRAILTTPRRPGDETIKGDGSPVTQADHAAHAVIDAGLAALAPGVPILSEEGRHLPADERAAWRTFWLVDPLDGTKEYLKGVPDYTVNIALLHEGVPVLGVVHAPARRVTYTGARGIGSTRTIDGASTRLVARRPAPGAPVRIAESRSHPSPDTEAFLAPYRSLERVAIGSSLKFCLVADGSADAYVRLGPTMEWDVAAGDAVFRWASDGEAHPSPLVYNTSTLRNDAFVIGFLPPPPAVLVVDGDQGAVAAALVDALRAAGAVTERIDAAPQEAGDQVGMRAAEAAGAGRTVVVGGPSDVVARVVATPGVLTLRVRVGTTPEAAPGDVPGLTVDPAVETPAAAADRIVRWLTTPARLHASPPA